MSHKVPLKRWASVRVSNVDKKSVPGDPLVRLCNYTDVYYGDRITPDLPFMEATATQDQIHKFGLSIGDVLITKDSEDAADIGVPAYIQETAEDLVCGYHLAILRPDPNQLDGRYLYWSMLSRPVQDFLSNQASGITRYGLRIDDIGTTPIVHHPLEEQRAIADFLDVETARIDKLIDAKRRLITLLDERFSATRSRALGLDEFDPTSGTGTVPIGWRTPRLGVCIQLQRGIDLPEHQREPGEFPVVGSGGVSGWHSQPAVHGPGVVTGRYGTVGEVFYITTDYWPLNTTLYVKEFRGNHPEWVLHLLAALPLASESSKTAVTGINRNIIGLLRVPLPQPTEQENIATFLSRQSDISKQSSDRLVEQIELLEEKRQALITAAVTGEFTVPGAAA